MVCRGGYNQAPEAGSRCDLRNISESTLTSVSYAEMFYPQAASEYGRLLAGAESRFHTMTFLRK